MIQPKPRQKERREKGGKDKLWLVSTMLLGNLSWLLKIGCCCSAAQSCPTVCSPMDCSMPGFTDLHHLPEFAQTHVHWVNGAIPPSHPLLPPFSPALSVSQHQERVLEWAAMPYSRDLPDPKIKPLSLTSPALANGFFTTSTSEGDSPTFLR